eukprot:11842834-Prorocentrum_lima.AAC.1
MPHMSPAESEPVQPAPRADHGGREVPPQADQGGEEVPPPDDQGGRQGPPGFQPGANPHFNP